MSPHSSRRRPVISPASVVGRCFDLEVLAAASAESETAVSGVAAIYAFEDALKYYERARTLLDARSGGYARLTQKVRSCEAGRRPGEDRDMTKTGDGINPNVKPSGTGCVECLAANGWWLHLRRCAECGHIGCCDNSPMRHATAHFHGTGHPVIASFEPGEAWFYDYTTQEFVEGPHLAPPRWHPEDQPVPGPRGNVPPDWQSKLS